VSITSDDSNASIILRRSLDEGANSGKEASSNSCIAKIEFFALERYGEETFAILDNQGITVVFP